MDTQTPDDQVTHPDLDPEKALEALSAIDGLSLVLLRREQSATRSIREKLDRIAGAFGFEVVEEEDPCVDDDEDEDAPACLNENEAEEAHARAMRGDIAEAVIHLERALPKPFAIIAEKIGDHLRSIAR